MLSGIEINQSGPASDTVTGTFSQTFRLPKNYQRGIRFPEITGVALCQRITNTESLQITVTLEVYDSGWKTLASASTTKADTLGDFIWTELFFDNVIVDEIIVNNQFRWTITTNADTWYSLPNTLPLETGPMGGLLRFRLLTNTADSGIDFLGNRYRSIVTRNNPKLLDSGADANAYWLSKPNPSKFAVESLYFDMQSVDGSAITDRILVDPITPGVLFHLYYSDEGNPGSSISEWENKLWTPVSHTFKASRREEHALPQPITARYIKVEFSHLQAQHYSPGTYHQPTVYKKHPKWVLDYFLARMASDDDPFIARKVAVVYDAFDIAFNYYLDDLHQDPIHPEQLSQDTGALSAFLSDRQDLSDQVDSQTLDHIRASLDSYRQSPGLLAKGLNYLPSLYTQTTDTNYPVERIMRQVANTSQVSTLDRSPLIVEQNFPGLFFYLRSRHKYRELSASFEEDRAYFVGIRELAFTRDHYAVASDNSLYVETLSDYANVIRNDFIDQNYPPRKLGTSRI